MLDAEKIDEALRTIREVCKGYSRCSDCPLHIRDKGCAVNDCRPDRWELFSDVDNDTIPRMFRM